MNTRQSLYGSNRLHWGAIQIAGVYLLIGGLWILLSDQMAAKIAFNQTIKGWGYVIVTALLLYWLIHRHTAILRASEGQLQRVIDAFPALISYLDTDRRYQFSNSAYEEWFDEKVQGKYLEEVIGSTAYKTISKYVDKVLAGETVNYETVIPYKQGERFVNAIYIPDIGPSGQVKGFFALVQDVTESKQAKEEIRLWADAFEGCAHGIAVGDPATNRIMACNPAFARMYKESVEDIVGSAILSLYAPSDHEHVRRNVQKADQIGHARFESHMKRKDGSIFPVQMDLVSVLGDDGELLYRVATAQDISERKSIEEKLKASESKYRTLVEHLPLITYISDPDQYIGVTYISPQIEALGFDSKKWLADPELWFQQIHPEDQEHVSSELQRFESGDGLFQAEYRLRLPDGNVRWFHDESVRVKDQDGRTVLKQGFMLDVTDRKQAEEENKTLARFPNENPNPVLRATHEGKIVYANAASELLLSEWGSRVGDYLPADWIELIRELINTDTRKTLEVQCKDTTYSIMIVSVSEASYVNLYGADVTEHKQAEAALRNSQVQMTGIFNSAMDAIISVDTDQRILIFNPAAEAMFHCSQAEAIHQPLDRFIPERFRDSHRSYIQNFASTGATSRTMGHLGTVYGLRKNGEEFPVEASISKINLAGHDLFTVILRDITERKRTETALIESVNQFRTLFEASPDAILLIDPHDNWPIMDCNTAACQMNGYTRDELVGQPIDILNPRPLHPGELNDYLAKIRQADVLHYETLHRRKDGTEFPIDVSTSLISLGGREVLLGIDRDITERKQAEENLRRFELLSEHSRDIILFMRREDGRILEANAAAMQAYGYSRDELLALTVRDLRTSDSQGPAADQMAQADAGGILFETIHQRRDGTTFPVEVSSQGATIGGVRTLISIARDITERKQAEEALQLKEQLLHLTSEMAKVGGWEFDTQTLAGTWTDEVARIHDMEPSQETNVAVGLSFYVGESREKIDQAIKDAVELGKPYDLELEMVSAKGNHKWVRTMALPILQDGKVVKVQGIFQDITERKQIEKELQEAHDELELKVQERTAALSEANALLQALMDNIPDHIYFKDRQSRFIRNSRSQAVLLGLNDPAEVIGKTDFDFFPHAAKAYAEEQEVMRSGNSLVDFEEWVVWPDGREMWVSTTKLPLRNSQGQTIGIFGISHDITERKQTEQAIRQLNEDLEKQAAQLQAANKELEAFSYSVSHDLRAPLRAIDGYTRILMEDYGASLDMEGQRICGIISREARRMGQLIDDLLAFSRLGRKEMHSSKIDMRALAVSVLNEILKEGERERIDFHIARLPSAKGDSALIRQVWTNLLSNAIKFTSKKERAVIEVGGKTEKEEFLYYVRDSGAGFDMEYANKLFGVFQRLHSESEFEGTGVGLAIVQRIIRRHGGRVWAEGEVDKGATFYFALPRKENENE